MTNTANSKTNELYTAILALKNTEEAQKFFRDLMTESEIKEFSNRWQAAKMLNEKIPYVKIEKETGLSSRTIARVSSWLKKRKGGYKLILKRLHHHHNLPSSGKELS